MSAEIAAPRHTQQRWCFDSESKQCMIADCPAAFGIASNWRHHCRKCGILVCQDHSSKTGLLFDHLNKEGDLVHGLCERRVCDPCYQELTNEIYETADFTQAMKERGACLRVTGSNSRFGKDGFFKRTGMKNGRNFYSPVLEPDDFNSIFHMGKEWWHGSHAGASTPHVGQNGHVASDTPKPPEEGWSHSGQMVWL